MTSPIKAVEHSADVKLSPNTGDLRCSATWVAQQSCPSYCPFQNSGCYAESGNAGIHTKSINKVGVDYSPLDLAILEAAGIDTLSGKYPLRIHIVGDCVDDDCAQTVAASALRYMKKYNKPTFTYTHANGVKRASWGTVSVLRSCETLAQVKQAYAEGYAAALVVEHFEKETAYALDPEFKGVPCPYQLKNKEGKRKANSCVDCKMCFSDTKLRAKKLVILFSSHGSGKAKINAKLNMK